MSACILKTAPVSYPVSLLELKRHLFMESVSFGDGVDVQQSIAPGSHDVAASFSLVGSSVDVRNYDAVVSCSIGTVGGNSTVAFKVQESDDESSWTDWDSESFTTVTDEYSNTVQEVAYSGECRYIRVLATVATAASEFGASVVRYAPDATQDDHLNELLATATEYVESYLGGRSLVTQTWYYYPGGWPGWPDSRVMELPRAPLQGVTAIKYAEYDDTDFNETFPDASYAVNTIDDPGQVVLKYDASWPGASLRNYRPIRVEMVTGYGDPSDVPAPIRHAVKLVAADLFEHPEDRVTGTSTRELGWLDRFLAPYRLRGF